MAFPEHPTPLQDLPRTELLQMYRLMVLARRFDETVMEKYAASQIPGFMHLYIGEEAVAVGACAALRADDYITSTHRGHGHLIAKGGDPRYMMAELYAKSEGYCKGKGGSMHIACLNLGILGANGIVGGGFPIACGSGLSSRFQSNGKVTLCFFGDGASNEGSFHESLNLCSVWKLPVIFVCENNGYAQTTPQAEHQAVRDIAERAKAYAMSGTTADGTDVLDVHAKVAAAVSAARAGAGPALVECKTYRYRGHWEGDPQPYRTKAEIDEWKKKDCITSFRNRLIEQTGIDAQDLTTIENDIDRQMADAVVFAEDCAPPQPQEALEDVYTIGVAVGPADSSRSGPVIQLSSRRQVTLREAINGTLDAILAGDDKAILFGEDVALLGGAFSVTKGLLAKHGSERVRNTPISEAAIVGAAIGSSITGLKPIAEIMFCDFLYVAMDQLINQMAKMKYMYGGDAQLPIVIRTTYGAGFSAAAQHSQSNEAMFMHVPGLKIVMPSTPGDAAGLLLSAFQDPNPVLFYEHKGLYEEKGDVGTEPVPLGKAAVVRQGRDLTVVTYGRMRKICSELAGELQQAGVDMELIDLRTLLPLDTETIITSVKKTGRLAVVHEAPLTAGSGAEIAASVTECAFGYLEAPVKRIAGADTPIPFAPVLENYVIPSTERIAAELKEAMH